MAYCLLLAPAAAGLAWLHPWAAMNQGLINRLNDLTKEPMAI
jgi:hypothetical protein